MRIANTQLHEFLLDSGLLSKDIIESVFDEATSSGKDMEDVILEKKLLSEIEIQKMYAYILGIPYVDLHKVIIPSEVLHIIPEPIAKKHRIVAFSKLGINLRVAMLHPDDLQTIDFIKKKTGFTIVPCLTTKENIIEMLKQYEKSLKADFGELISSEDKPLVTESDEESLEKAAQGISVIRVVDTLLKHAILQSASDIHIEPSENEVDVRYRIDGILHDTMKLPKDIGNGLVARIKVLSNLKLDEHRLPQDGRFKIQSEEYKVAFRVSILPVFDGEKVVMRLLDEGSHGLTLEKMGFAGEPLEIIHREIRKPNGMVLVTGPTGSGKTTTLYTVLDILNTPEVNVSTVEDPVEYRMARVNQTQVNPKIGMTFAAALRSLLRQDPDIIMVGEIRDQETLEIALHAAMTGHLVLSTLHTNSAAATLPRMLDMGAEPFLIASTVNVVIAQRLTRRLCQECKEEYHINVKEIEALSKSFDMKNVFEFLTNQKEFTDLVQVSKGWEGVVFYRAKGCDQCGGEGYKGRMGIYEVLEMTDEIKKLVTQEASTEVINMQAQKTGMITMTQDGFMKVVHGITSVEEILRVTKE